MAATAASRTGVSPSSSPRLPSPPPFTEVQFGPKSPGGSSTSITELELEAAAKQDDGALRRIRPGTKAVDMARGPPFVPLHQLESAFQLQEYLKTLYHKLTRDDATNTTRPVSKEMALELAAPPTAVDTGETVDRNLWLYELCRFLCAKSTRMIVAFFADSPPCSSQTCPEMRASEWQYLCAVHDPPKSCCAIDYCNHTLDWASNILTSTKHFPSRLSLGGEGTNALASMRQITNVFRRVYRIYAHAWFQHREVFWSIETELGLYMLFKTVCDVYQLEENYTIPPEAEGRPEDSQDDTSTLSPERIQILQKESESPVSQEAQANTTISTGATTRRHKHTPSTGVPVPMIAEGTEEEEEVPMQISRKELPMHTSRPTGIDRVGPGRIDLPQDRDAERVPEDPTPIAQPGSSPLAISMDQAHARSESVSNTFNASHISGPAESESQNSIHHTNHKDVENHTADSEDDTSARTHIESSPPKSKAEEQPAMGDSDAETTILSTSDESSTTTKIENAEEVSYHNAITKSVAHIMHEAGMPDITPPSSGTKDEDDETIEKIEIPHVLVQDISHTAATSHPNTLSQPTEAITNHPVVITIPPASATSTTSVSKNIAEATSSQSQESPKKHADISSDTKDSGATSTIEPAATSHTQTAHPTQEPDKLDPSITTSSSTTAAASAAPVVQLTKHDATEAQAIESDKKRVGESKLTDEQEKGPDTAPQTKTETVTESDTETKSDEQTSKSETETEASEATSKN